MSSKFRSTNNQLIVRNLFYEVARDRYGNFPEPNTVLYTLGREDITEDDKLYPSLYKLYMEEGDLTEYMFATKYFDSFQHWKKICATTWMHPLIGEWREELELKIRAAALGSLIKRSEQSTEIAKYLLNNDWVTKLHEKNPVNNLRGRPSKEEIKGHLTVITNNKLREQQDYERIKNI